MVRMAERRVTSVKLSDEERAHVRASAEAAGISMGEYIRKCIHLGASVQENQDIVKAVHRELLKAVDITLRQNLVRKKKAG